MTFTDVDTERVEAQVHRWLDSAYEARAEMCARGSLHTTEEPITSEARIRQMLRGEARGECFRRWEGLMEEHRDANAEYPGVSALIRTIRWAREVIEREYGAVDGRHDLGEALRIARNRERVKWTVDAEFLLQDGVPEERPYGTEADL